MACLFPTQILSSIIFNACCNSFHTAFSTVCLFADCRIVQDTVQITGSSAGVLFLFKLSYFLFPLLDRLQNKSTILPLLQKEAFTNLSAGTSVADVCPLVPE